jgi:hypothetical protein
MPRYVKLWLSLPALAGFSCGTPGPRLHTHTSEQSAQLRAQLNETKPLVQLI